MPFGLGDGEWTKSLPPAWEDERPAGQGLPQCRLLTGRKLLAGFLLAPCARFLDINRRVIRTGGAQVLDLGGDDFLRPFQVRQKNEFLLANGLRPKKSFENTSVFRLMSNSAKQRSSRQLSHAEVVEKGAGSPSVERDSALG